MQPSLVQILEQLERWGAGRDWVGPDPYEGLNTPLGRLAPSKRGRQAVIQAYKRFPVRPPWPLLATPKPNAKALALVLSAYASPAGRRLPAADEFLTQLPRRLERLNLSDAGAAWGYHFDAQTRHLFYSRETPNAIATSFVVGALCDAAEATGERRHAELALATRPYLLSLLKEAPGRGPFFAYVEQGSELIHNANVLVCGAVARLHGLRRDDASESAVRSAVTTTLSRQREDGLWAYGEAPNLAWADNLHTAYILEGLARVEDAFGIGTDALEHGLGAWRGSFFEADGWARYYPDHRFPLEAHCCASAIDLLCQLERRRPDPAYIALAERIAGTAIRELWLPERGCFAFRRTALGLNRRAFMRWTNAPMFRALARLCGRLESRATATGVSSRNPERLNATT